MSEYGNRVIKHFKVQNGILWQLLKIAQELCPDGEWVFQFMAYPDFIDGKVKNKFMAVCTNGDDNVTAMAENPGAAVALLIHYLLDGSVFPLTGEGGRKFYPADRGWIKAPDKDEEPQHE